MTFRLIIYLLVFNGFIFTPVFAEKKTNVSPIKGCIDFFSNIRKKTLPTAEEMHRDAITEVKKEITLDSFLFLIPEEERYDAMIGRFEYLAGKLHWKHKNPDNPNNHDLSVFLETDFIEMYEKLSKLKAILEEEFKKNQNDKIKEKIVEINRVLDTHKETFSFINTELESQNKPFWMFWK